MMKTRNRRLMAIVLLLSITTLVLGMGLFDFMKVCLFSEVGGVVTLAGKPVAGVELVRTAKFDDKDYTDKTTTDAQGKFHFDPVFSTSLLKWDPSIFQTIILHYQGKEYIGWKLMRTNYELNGELDDNKLLTNMLCELSIEPTKKDQLVRRPVNGICKW